MNNRYYSPNNHMQHQDQYNYRPSNEMNYRHRSMGGPSPNWRSPTWQSPAWRPRQQNFVPSGGWQSNNGRYSNSPNDSSYYSARSFNDTSTPQGRRSSGGNSFNNSSNSGFIPLSFSPRRGSPYSRGGNFPRGRRSYDRPRRSQNFEKEKPPVQLYFKPSMLEDPWKNCDLSKASKTDAKVSMFQSSTSKRYFAKDSFLISSGQT